MKLLSLTKPIFSVFTFLCVLGLSPYGAFGAITYTSSTAPSLSLYTTTIDENGSGVFIFKGLADGESATISFATDAVCPMVAMTGGASFDSTWSCTGGVITTAVTYRGGLSFGPGTDENADSFYLTFSDPPAPGGSTAPPTEFNGIQISVYGDIASWDLSGDMSSSGTSFGIELSGPQGGEAHFAMTLPSAAVTFLGGVLGVSVGGKIDPFATVTTNDDGSVTIKVDITNLQSSSIRSLYHRVKANKTITKKIVATERSLSIAASKRTVKPGASMKLAICAGKTYTAGDKATLQYLISGKAVKGFKVTSATLDAKGCATKTVKVPSSVRGSLVSRVTYKGKKASTTVLIK